MQWGFIALAAVGGALLPLQALINARLGQSIGGPLWAACTSFLIGTVGLALFLVAQRAPLPALGQLPTTPWLWAGGLLGAFYVAAAIVSVQHLGAAATIAVVIAGQLTASLLLDHFGVLAAPHPLSFMRIAGAVLLFAGAWLITRF
ncbi:MAG: DMT family transporter [Caenispirillum sp.]|nr:DMT family transporter [Caenispirillum sp.]